MLPGLGKVLHIVVELGQQHLKCSSFVGIVAGGDEFLVVTGGLLLQLQANHGGSQGAKGAVLEVGRWIKLQQFLHVLQRGLVVDSSAGRITGRILLLGHLVIGTAAGQESAFGNFRRQRFFERQREFTDRVIVIALDKMHSGFYVVELAL